MKQATSAFTVAQRVLIEDGTGKVLDHEGFNVSISIVNGEAHSTVGAAAGPERHSPQTQP